MKMERLTDYLTHGYKNIKGTLRLLGKAFLFGLVVTLLLTILLVLIGVGCFLAVDGNLLGGTTLLTVVISLVVGLGSVFLTPYLANMSIILVREYIYYNSSIKIKEAFQEGAERLRGRYFGALGKSIVLPLLAATIMAVCGITVIGVLFVPVISSALSMALMVAYYQDEVGATEFVKENIKNIAILTLISFIVTLVACFIPIVGTLLIVPLNFWSQLYVIDYFEGY